jgi:hypothetical protein
MLPCKRKQARGRTATLMTIPIGLLRSEHERNKCGSDLQAPAARLIGCWLIGAIPFKSLT